MPYVWDESEDEEEEDRSQKNATIDTQVFLLDCGHALMFEATTSEEDPEAAGRPRFDVAVGAIVRALKEIILQFPTDKVAIVLYGTKTSKNPSEFKNVYVFSALKETDAETLKRLEGLKRESVAFDAIGSACGSNADRTESLKLGLWTATKLLEAAKTSTKSIHIITTDEDPSDGAKDARRKCATRAADIRARGVWLSTWALAPSGAYDRFLSFWGGDIGADLRAAGEEPEPDGVLAGLQDGLRKASGARRSLGRLKWDVGGGVEIAVRLHALVRPTTKRATLSVHRDTGEVLKRVTTLVDEASNVLGRVPKKVFKAVEGAGDEPRFPRAILEAGEVACIKSPFPSGITLLGFKPAGCLKEHHQVKPSVLVYPDEKAAVGSTEAFAAVRTAMVNLDRIAICRWVKSRTSSPTLVAMYPAVAQRSSVDGSMVEPDGLHAIVLPFADDMRHPHTDRNVTDLRWSRPTREMIDLADDFMSTSKLINVTVDFFDDPDFYRYTRVLQAKAMDEDIPEFDSDDDLTVQDPMYNENSEKLEAIDAFREAVWGDWDPKSKPMKKTTGSKRPAMTGAEPSEEDWARLKASGGRDLGKRTVAELKAYCKGARLAVTGKKADLVGRLQAHLDGGP